MTTDRRDLASEILRPMRGDLAEPCQQVANRSLCDVLRRRIQPGLEEARRGELVVGSIEEILDGIDRALDAVDERAVRGGLHGSPR